MASTLAPNPSRRLGSAAPSAALRPIVDAVLELIGRGRQTAGQTPRTDPGSPSARGIGVALRPLSEFAARHEILERVVPVCICALLVGAALLSSLPVAQPAPAAAAVSSPTVVDGGAGPVVAYGPGDGPGASSASDLYLGDGSISNTMQNPGVGTDARTILLTYIVQPRDTLTKIAERFGLATSTVYWANKAAISDPGSLRVGQQLLIPPIDGLLVTVGAKDTIDAIAAKYNVSAQDIIDTNNLVNGSATAGQVLLIPGASGGPVPKSTTGSSSGGGAGGWVWPISGYSTISQYFWSGHHALDIAAPYGAPVIAAVSGTVVLAGWRSYTGGGNVIWVEVNSKLYTTYNHLSAWNVRAGQKVSAGQRIGSVGTSGEATGPHLHFEVWQGYPWALGTVADAVNPCIYLAGC